MSSVRSTLTIAVLAIATTQANATDVETIRLDINSTPLAIYNAAWFEDYPIPAEDATVVETRVHLEFHTQTFAGDYEAENFWLKIWSPIDRPGFPGVALTYVLTGPGMGWSGSGEFTFDGVIPITGELIPATPPDNTLLWGLEYNNASNLTVPPPTNPTPLGGQLFNSYIEIDYVLDVPAPASAMILPCAVALATRRRRSS